MVTILSYVTAFVLPAVPAGAQEHAAHPLDGADLRRVLAIAAPVPPPKLKAPAGTGTFDSFAGQPGVLDTRSPLSAAVMTTVGGRGTQFSDVTLLADWDGKEDLTADRAAQVADLSGNETDVDATLTRTAISAHTYANGFNENVYYYGDSEGNVFVGVDTDPAPGTRASVDEVYRIHLPTALNAFGSLDSDDQIVVTGLCVSPVADLTSFTNVNSIYSPFNGAIGEILYVTYTDTGGGLRLASDNQIMRSGVLAFPIADMTSPAPNPPGVLTPAGFPVTVGGSFGVVFSTFSNLAGCAVDDDGNLYFQQVDLQQFTGANIVKVTRVGSSQDRSLATSGIVYLTTLNPPDGVYGTTTGPSSQVNRFTNYSGTSTAFGNITALAAGPQNTLYAAFAASADSGAPATGLFANPPALGPTPSMIASFADTIGVFSANPLVVVPDGFADPAIPGAAVVPGVNNFRAFVLGNGPDRRGAPAAVFGTTSDTLKVDLQVDYTIYSGLTVNEDRQVFVIHGGTPAGVGLNPSPGFGEIQVYTDRSPADRRADYVDLRGDVPPSGPVSGGNVGDNDSDRYDHIFAQAPIDPVTMTPTGFAGLATGFLRFTNRLAPRPISPGLTLGQDGGARTLGDDESVGPIYFDALDPGHQVAGGDDQRQPGTGDDRSTGGYPPVADNLAGGFEFNFGATVSGMCTAPWNAFHLQSDGTISFNEDIVDATATAEEFLSGPPRIAAAWRNFDPASRTLPAVNTFPVQALGFAGINHFKVRWINVPQSGLHGEGSRNTFSISLFDDGTGIDENDPGNAEGPTDTRFVQGATGALPGGTRPDGSAAFAFEYGWMDPTVPFAGDTVVGYSVGGVAPGTIAEGNLSEAGRLSVIGGGTTSEVAIFELFTGADFDLRAEGNDPSASMASGQLDPSREYLEFFGKSCDMLALTLITDVVGSGSVTGPGISCPGDCTETLPSGTIQVLTATPAPGWMLAGWTGCDSSNGNVCTVTVSGTPELVRAIFTQAPPVRATLNQFVYRTGDVLVLTVSLDPTFAGPGPVDAYVLVDTPGFGTFSVRLGPALVPGQFPVVSNFTPIPFSGVLMALPLPASLPAGGYQFRTFLTQAGTTNVIGATGVTPFIFTP